MNERLAFLKAIEAEPTNYLTRYVFADWLDERGEHEEADRQRQFEAADKWLREVIAPFTLSRYAGDYSPVTYDWLIEQANDCYLEVMQGEEYPCVFFGNRENLMYALMDPPNGKEKFWRCWSIVTGQPLLSGLVDAHFQCGC